MLKTFYCQYGVNVGWIRGLPWSAYLHCQFAKKNKNFRKKKKKFEKKKKKILKIDLKNLKIIYKKYFVTIHVI